MGAGTFKGWHATLSWNGTVRAWSAEQSRWFCRGSRDPHAKHARLQMWISCFPVRSSARHIRVEKREAKYLPLRLSAHYNLCQCTGFLFQRGQYAGAGPVTTATERAHLSRRGRQDVVDALRPVVVGPEYFNSSLSHPALRWSVCPLRSCILGWRRWTLPPSLSAWQLSPRPQPGLSTPHPRRSHATVADRTAPCGHPRGWSHLESKWSQGWWSLGVKNKCSDMWTRCVL